MKRRLAAILAADVVGYSRLIRADEEGTIAALKALRADSIDPRIAEHHGRIVKLMGDGMLAEFASIPTPFVVVTVSQLLGIRLALLDAGRGLAPVFPRDAFLATALSRGIPLRSLLLGLIVGTVNTSIVISAALMDGGKLADLPAALIGQAFVLPVLFGLVSQAISYRRAALVIGRRLQAEAQPLSI